MIQTYLYDAEVPFLCGKQTLESWKFKIDGVEKILEIEVKTDQKNSKKFLKMIDTAGGHYAVGLETRKRQNFIVLYLEDMDLSILFLENEEGDLCLFEAVRKIHEVNCHKSKEQLLAAYHNTGWMSPKLVNVIT